MVTNLIILGNNRTKESYLRRFIYCQEGVKYDSLMIEEDMRRLRTLPSVMQVEDYIVENDSGTMLIYQVTERYTILPIGDFGVSDDYYYFGLGLMETNAFGRGVYFLGFYRFSRQHSFQTIFKIPYLFGTKFGLHAQAYLWNTEENIFLTDDETKYSYNYFDVQLLLRYEIAHEHIVHAGFVHHYDKYTLKDTTLNAAWDKSFFYEYSGLKVTHRIEHIDNNFFMLDGWSNVVISEFRLPQSNNKNSLYFSESFRLYNRIGKKGNLCTQVNAGFSTANIDPYSDFTLSDYKNIRGIGYNARRGSSVVSFNAEYRQVVFQGHYFAYQAVAFADAGNIREYQKDIETLFHPSEFDLYGGFGLRWVFIEAHNAVLSIDYGIKSTNFKSRGFVFRWGQFF